ncbi:hypothetical protein ACFFRR_000871 [Megaselia abdita]
MLRLVVFSSLLVCAFAGLNSILQKVPIPDGKIVGGHDVSIEEFPYQISMQLNGRHRCGGSIYNERIIISAAHCVHGLSDDDVEKLSIVAGITKLSQTNGQRSFVEKYIIHESYKTLNNDFDVALLVLKTPFKYNDKVRPVKLDRRLAAKGTEVIVTGWGTTTEGGSIPDHLQEVVVEIIPNEECKNAYKILLTSRMLCAGVEKGGKDACQGDSGGPLVNTAHELLGIVSWGFGCAQEKKPGVYASVPAVWSWIESTAAKN